MLRSFSVSVGYLTHPDAQVADDSMILQDVHGFDFRKLAVDRGLAQ